MEAGRVSKGGQAHLAPGAGDNFRGFFPPRGTSQVSNPSGRLISLRGRARPSTGSETLGLGFSWARPSEGMGGHTLDLQT